jgi:hypothetical protein
MLSVVMLIVAALQNKNGIPGPLAEVVPEDLSQREVGGDGHDVVQDDESKCNSVELKH